MQKPVQLRMVTVPNAMPSKIKKKTHDMVVRALAAAGLSGRWQLRPFQQKKSGGDWRLRIAPLNGDVVVISTRPSDNGSSWQSQLWPISGGINLKSAHKGLADLASVGDPTTQLKQFQTRHLKNGFIEAFEKTSEVVEEVEVSAEVPESSDPAPALPDDATGASTGDSVKARAEALMTSFHLPELPAYLGSGMYSLVMTISPELALEWLDEHYGKNRKKITRQLAMLADDINNHRWRLSHQAVAFSTAGVLIDGQHRLESIVNTLQEIQLVVTFDVPESAKEAIDTGIKRSNNDQDIILGTNYASVTAIARAAYVGGSATRPALSRGMLRDFVDAHSEAFDWLRTHWVPGRKQRGTGKAAIAAAILRAWYHIDHEVLARFVEVYLTGKAADSSEYAAIVLYRRMFGHTKNGDDQQKAKNFLLTCKAIELFNRGIEPQRLFADKKTSFLLPEETLDTAEV